MPKFESSTLNMVKVEIFSDIACPFCFIGTRRFLRVLSEHPRREDVEVTWRSFQLDPTAPRRADGDLLDHLTAKFGISRDEAKSMNERVISMGREEGIEFDFERAHAVNTFDAHRMMQLAAFEFREAELADLLFDAYFTGSADLSESEELVRLAVDAGVDPARAAEVAGNSEFAEGVRADQEMAGLLGISSVPAFVFDRKTALSGAQPAEVMAAAIDQALSADG